MAAVTASNDSVIYICGELNFANVPVLSQNNRRLIMERKEVTFDLSQVTAIDNTGVALLISLTRYAKGLGKKIRFINLPKQLLELADAVRVKKFII